MLNACGQRWKSCTRSTANVTWERQRKERDAFDANTDAAIGQAKEYVGKPFKPQWRELYRWQPIRSHAPFPARAARAGHAAQLAQDASDDPQTGKAAGSDRCHPRARAA